MGCRVAPKREAREQAGSDGSESPVRGPGTCDAAFERCFYVNDDVFARGQGLVQQHSRGFDEFAMGDSQNDALRR